MKNHAGDMFKETWLRLSKISPKFDPIEANALWDTIARSDYDGPALTIASIRNMALADDPHGYALWRGSIVSPVSLDN